VALAYKFLRIEADPHAEVKVVRVIFPVHPVEFALKFQTVGVNCAEDSAKIDSITTRVIMNDFIVVLNVALDCLLVQRESFGISCFGRLSHGIESKYFID
jgi:hypothetical protein